MTSAGPEGRPLRGGAVSGEPALAQAEPSAAPAPERGEAVPVEHEPGRYDELPSRYDEEAYDYDADDYDPDHDDPDHDDPDYDDPDHDDPDHDDPDHGEADRYAGDGDLDGEADDGFAEAGFEGAGGAGPDGAGGADLEGAERPLSRGRRRRRRVTTVLLGLLTVVVVVGVVGFFHVSAEINPGGRPGRLVDVYIPKGASTVDVGRILVEKGVIHGEPTVFGIYVKLTGGGPLLAGTYQLHQNLPYATAISALRAGPSQAEFKLVVPEGFNVRQMAAAVARLHVGITAAQFEEAATRGQVRSAFEPAGTNNLEGMLFPATYPVHPGETADELVQYMASTFDQEATSLGLASAAKKLGYTPYQVVEVASIVEREAKLAQDRGPIASVIYNRLARGMDIGAQSTLLYGLGDPKGNVSIYTPNPYNTQVNSGLPPTPIASPGVPSLEAAMHPPHTDYLYWVEVNPDGKMGFASTTAGFDQLQLECRAQKLGC